MVSCGYLEVWRFRVVEQMQLSCLRVQAYVVLVVCVVGRSLSQLKVMSEVNVNS